MSVSRSQRVSGNFANGLSAAVPLSVSRGIFISANFTNGFSAVVPLSVGSTQRVSANFASGFSAVVPLSVARTRDISARFESRMEAYLDLTGASDLLGMSVCQVVDEILSMWGMFCRKSAPDFARDRALNDLNAAMQMVWNNAEGRDYWANETLTLTLADGESSIDLADDIQNVIGPCRRADNRRPLVPIGTIGELETFSDLYLDGETTNEPLAYHVERMTQSGVDPAKCVLHVTPAVVGASFSFLLNVVKEAPRFRSDDLITCPVIPIPHRYVETLLLPIAKYLASSYYLFRQQELKPTIDREYQRASISLGLADPLPGNAGDNRNKREETPK